ncbi:MAG: hypothetical protein QM817_19665 [Archangium sp.]
MLQRERLIGVMRMACVAIAIAAVSQRAPVLEETRNATTSLSKHDAAQPGVIALPRLELLKRTLGPAQTWAIVHAATFSLEAPHARLARATSIPAVDLRQRARLKAHPAHGPPALS